MDDETEDFQRRLIVYWWNVAISKEFEKAMTPWPGLLA
jgi:hypothetical protein